MATTRRRLAFRIVLASVLAFGTLASAQAPPAGRETSAASVAGYALSAQMPVDPEAVVGTLPNGLRYYVRANAKPASRAELRLVVKAGSVLEDDDQQGLAHFVEHMQFEGTKHFPRQSLSEFLSSMGMSIGADANAGTSYDDTQYTLRVPTDVPGVLDRALLVLEDWAQGATFDQEGIDRERGIVLSEWRMNLGAGERTQDKLRRVQLAGSRYPDRSPIGKPEVIERAQREQLTRFYRDWYRPESDGGDRRRRRRSERRGRDDQEPPGLTSPSPVRPRPAIDVPDQPGTRYALVTDKEMTATVVQLGTLRPARNQGSVGGYRDIILDQLFGAMLTDRLDEISQGQNPPFIRAAANRGLFPMPRTKDQAALQALVANDGVTRGLDALVTELQRVTQFGFTASELERAKQTMMANYERVVTESPDRESASRADEYTRNFLQGEALPTIWQELAFHRRFVPPITLAEINARAGDWFPERNRIVIVSAPDAAGVTLPTEAQLEAAVKSASAKRLTAYVDAGAGEALVDAPPARGTIVKTAVRAEAGITEWTLSNGVTVVLKPTTLKEDRDPVSRHGQGGHLAGERRGFHSGPHGGLGRGGGRRGALQRRHARQDARRQGRRRDAVHRRDRAGDGGRQHAEGSRDDVPADLPAVHAAARRSDRVRRDDVAGEGRCSPTSWRAPTSSSTRRSTRRSAATARDAGPKRPQPWTSGTSPGRWRSTRHASRTRATSRSCSSAASRPRRSSRSSRPTSPACRRPTRARPGGMSGSRCRAASSRRRSKRASRPRARWRSSSPGRSSTDDAHKLALRAMTLVLQSRLLDTIRQELGGTYSITASPGTAKFPRPEYSVRIDWTCDPARTADLARRVFEEIEFVKNTPLSRGQVTAIRDSLLREYQVNSQENGYLLNQISRPYQDGDPAAVARDAQHARPDRRADRRGGDAGGADLSEHRQLREGHVDAGRKVEPAPTRGWLSSPAGRFRYPIQEVSERDRYDDRAG